VEPLYPSQTPTGVVVVHNTAATNHHTPIYHSSHCNLRPRPPSFHGPRPSSLHRPRGGGLHLDRLRSRKTGQNNTPTGINGNGYTHMLPPIYTSTHPGSCRSMGIPTLRNQELENVVVSMCSCHHHAGDTALSAILYTMGWTVSMPNANLLSPLYGHQ
jgi:hypothetical protein